MRKSKVYLILIIMMLLIPGSVYGAGYQANKNGNTKQDKAETLFKNIRGMSSSEGTLGVENNNNIDCHMSLNTEWGTAAMLAISDFGYGYSNINNITTTTGNETGIKDMQDNKPEYVSGYLRGSTNQFIQNILNANSIYRNDYEASGRINGDAINISTGDYDISTTYPAFERGYNSNLLNASVYQPGIYGSAAARAVVVNVGGPTN